VLDTKRLVESEFSYTFKNESLLEQAFTHRSASSTHNERLEFLGDAVLDLVISDLLFKRFPEADEGDLSRMRSWLVKKESLYIIGTQYKLSSHIVMGSGEARSGGQQRKSTIADAVEALIAAIYIDSNYEQVKLVIEQMFEQRLSELPDQSTLKDAKSLLQEYLQHHKIDLPEYSLIKEQGKPHEKVFTVSCTIQSLNITVEAEGISRRKAEKICAEKALKELKKLK